MEFKNKTVTLMGLGTQGGGVEDALFFIKSGVKKIIITDLKTKTQLDISVQKINNSLHTIESSKRPKIKWVLGNHKEKDFINTDLVIKNPGVPPSSKYLSLAQKNNIPITTSTNIFFDLFDNKKIIGITGTKGKSTTAQLIYEIVKTKYPSSAIAGIPGKSPLSLFNKTSNKFTAKWVILELSSWDLEDMAYCKKSPHIAVITNIEQDHLNRHKSFKNYVEAKKNIFKYQTKKDYLIINNNLKNITKNAPSNVIYFGNTTAKNTTPNKTYPENINAAVCVANILNINQKEIIEVLKNFKPLPGRLELAGELAGIKIYNDTTATNPYAALRAIESFGDKKIALIVGGEDKGLDYSTLVKKLSKLHFVALLPGSASDKMYSNPNLQMHPNTTNIKRVENIKEALKKCLNSKPDVILFSPAAASFNMFLNEFERGKEFNKVVKSVI